MDDDEVPELDGHIDVQVPGEDREEPLDHQELELGFGDSLGEAGDELVHEGVQGFQFELVVAFVEGVDVLDEAPSYHQVIEGLEGLLFLVDEEEDGGYVGHALHVPYPGVVSLEHLQQSPELIQHLGRLVEELEFREGSGDIVGDQLLGQRVDHLGFLFQVQVVGLGDLEMVSYESVPNPLSQGMGDHQAVLDQLFPNPLGFSVVIENLLYPDSHLFALLDNINSLSLFHPGIIEGLCYFILAYFLFPHSESTHDHHVPYSKHILCWVGTHSYLIIVSGYLRDLGAGRREVAMSEFRLYLLVQPQGYIPHLQVLLGGRVGSLHSPITPRELVQGEGIFILQPLNISDQLPTLFPHSQWLRSLVPLHDLLYLSLDNPVIVRSRLQLHYQIQYPLLLLLEYLHLALHNLFVAARRQGTIIRPRRLNHAQKQYFQYTPNTTPHIIPFQGGVNIGQIAMFMVRYHHLFYLEELCSQLESGFCVWWGWAGSLCCSRRFLKYLALNDTMFQGFSRMTALEQCLRMLGRSSGTTICYAQQILCSRMSAISYKLIIIGEFDNWYRIGRDNTQGIDHARVLFIRQLERSYSVLGQSLSVVRCISSDEPILLNLTPLPPPLMFPIFSSFTSFPSSPSLLFLPYQINSKSSIPLLPISSILPRISNYLRIFPCLSFSLSSRYWEYNTNCMYSACPLT